MTKREVNDYLIKNAAERGYKADGFTEEGYGQTIGGYHNKAKKRGVEKPTQKWHFTVSYFEGIDNKDVKPTYYSLHCPELMIWIAEVAGLNEKIIDDTIKYVKKFEDDKNMKGKEKGTDFYAPIESVIKDMLRMSDINHIISESGCWEDVVNKVSKLKFRNVPATFKAYAIINDWGVEECDDISELYYEKIAKLLNEFDVIEPYEYDQYGITPETDFQELMDIHIKYNRVSKSVVNKLEKLLDEKIYPLGAEYGFLGDLIIEVFYERLQWYF